MLVFSSLACGEEDEKAYIAIPANYDVTGPWKSIGYHFANAVQLAEGHINSAGGVEGTAIEVLAQDNQGDTKLGVQQINDAYDDEPFSILLSAQTSVSMVYRSKFVMPKKIMFFTFSTSPETTVDSNGMIKNFCADATKEMDAVWDYAQDNLNCTKVAFVYVDDNAGILVQADKLKSLVTETEDVSVVLDRSIPGDKTTFQEDVTATGDANPNCIFLGALPEMSIDFLKAWYMAYPNSTAPFLFTHYGTVESILVNLGDSAANLEGSITGAPTSEKSAETDIFTDAYKARFSPSDEEKDMAVLSASAYDSVIVAALLYQAVGKPKATPQELQAAFSKVFDPSAEVVGPSKFQHAKDLLDSGASIQFAGAYTDYNWDDQGQDMQPIVVSQIEDGQVVEKARYFE